MIDKLHLKTQDIVNLDKLPKIDSVHNYAQVPDAQYRKCIVIRNGSKHFLTIKTLPYLNNLSPTEIQLNPSNWGSFSLIKNTLNKITNLEALKVLRIDHAVDIERPIEATFYSLRVKHKQDCTVFNENMFKRGVLTGYYLGSKSSPELYCIYDKGFQLSSNGSCKRDKSHNLGTRTRIEVRQKKKKILLPNFLDLPKYQEISPFNNIEWLEMNNLMENDERSQALQTLIRKDGLTNVYQQLNNHNNFKRNYKMLMSQVSFSDELTNSYWCNLGQFFGDDNG